MSGRDQTIDNRVHDIAMSGEQFTAAAEILMPILSLGETSEPQAAAMSGLPVDGEDETIDHSANDGGIGLVID